MDSGTGVHVVGRESELSRLNSLVDGLVEGRGGLAWLRGEPGIGKSALADAMARRAAALGCAVFRGAGEELTQAFPLRLVAECMRVSARSPDADRVEIAELLQGATGRPVAVDPVLAASERILALIDRSCAKGPVALLAEDLQWADEPSLVVLSRLARSVGQIPLLLVGTSQPVARRSTDVRLFELVGDLGGQALELGPLDDVAVAHLAARITGAEPGPRLRTELARAGGNPLYARELLDALVRDRLVDVVGEVAELRGDPGGTPSSLTVAIGRRLELLPPDTAQALRMAAFLGGDFDIAELTTVTGGTSAELTTAIEEAVVAGVVRPAGQRFAFRHELIRQVLVDQTSPPMRVGLHSHIARALATAGSTMDVVAPHLLALPGGVDGWVPAWLADVPESTVYAAPDVAAELLARAVRSAGADHPRWVDLAARLAQVSFWLGRDEQAGDIGREVARRTGDAELVARMTILVLRSAGRMGRPGEALPDAVSALRDERIPLAWRARLGAWSAATLAVVGQVAEARREAHSAMRAGERAADPVAVAYARHALALTTGPAEAVAHIEAALSSLGEDAESMDVRLLLLNNLLTYLAALSRWEEAEAAQQPALVLAEQVGTFRSAGLLATAAEVAYMNGRWDDAVVFLNGIGSEFLDSTSNLNARALAALIALHREDRDTAALHLQAADAAVTLARRHGDPPANWRLAAAWALQAEAHERDLRRALELMATLLNPAPLPGQQTRHELMPHVVRLALAVGDKEMAAAATAACRADADAEPLAGRLAAARCCQAQLDKDGNALLAAADDYRRSGWPLQLAFALEEAAVCLADARDTTRARAAFADAARAYSDLGATWDLRRAEGRVRPFGIRRGPRSAHRRATSGWEALTPAEIRVTHLVAQGLPNPDVAARLFVSRRTVQAHVSNVLVKLNLRSRADLAHEIANREREAP